MTTSGVEGPQRPAETPDTDGAGAIDGPGQVDGSGGPESLEDDFKPVPESVRDHARWMGQLSEMGPQTVQAGSDVERIADQGFNSEDEARIQQLLDRLLEESL